MALNQAADTLCLALERSLDGLGGAKPGSAWIRYRDGWWHCGVECWDFGDQIQSSGDRFESAERDLPKAALAALREVEEWRDEAVEFFQKEHPRRERADALASRLDCALGTKSAAWPIEDGRISVSSEAMERLLSAFDRLVALQGREDGGAS